MTAAARYHRQRILAEVGEAGEARLRGASVLVVGAGGLGSPAALYLAAAGVGRLGLIDDQRVELSNLHRQILHSTADVGQPKVRSGAAALARLNPGVVVEPMQQELTPDNAAALLARYDLVLDGADNFETKFLINDACVIFRRPFVHGAVAQWGGQLFTYRPEAPCLRCLFRDPPPPEAIASCEEAGIVGPVAGVVGSLMASETLKLILQAGALLTGQLLTLDALGAEVRAVTFSRDDACPICGRGAPANWDAYTRAVSARGHLTH